MEPGYYKQEVEARFTEGILAKSRDWQWFLEETVKTFEAPSWEDGTFSGFRKAFYRISSVYGHLSSIADIWPDLLLSFPCDWMLRIWESCLIRAGIRELTSKPTNNKFFDLLDVISYSTKLLNSISDRKFTYDLGIFSLGNYQDLFELSDFTDEGDKIVDRLGEIGGVDLGATIAVIKGNFDGERVTCNDKMIVKVLDDEFDADFLDFKAPENLACKTWQEVFFLDCLKTSYRGGELVPLVGFRNGGSIPDFSLMTEAVLANMRCSIGDVRAHCVIDTVGYLLHKMKIPQESIDLLVDLSLGRMEEVSAGTRESFEFDCTSVWLCAQMIARNELPGTSKAKLLAGISRITGRENVDILATIERIGFPLSKEQKNLLADAKRRKCLLIDSITDSVSLRRYIEDWDVSRYCSQVCAEKTMDKFVGFVSGAETDTGLLFISTMNFFIRLLNNKNIDNQWAKKCLIDVQVNWTETFYACCMEGMQTFERKIPISDAQIDEMNKAIMDNPLLFGHWALSLNENAIEERIEAIAKNPLVAMVQKISVDEFIPYKKRFDSRTSSNKHSVDAMILDEIDRINKKYYYRHINQLKADELTAQICTEAVQNTQILSSMVHVMPEIYESVRNRVAGTYSLIDYPAKGEMPTLAHVCQLFPVMEGTIRELGKHFLITPFRAREDEFHMLRDAPQIMGELIGLVRDETGTIAGTDDMTFVYFAMFSKNGLNIRNACVHGQGYQRGERLKEAFKLTVICVHMLLFRLDMVTRAEDEMLAPGDSSHARPD